MGIPLHQIAGIRSMYNESPLGTTKIDFDRRLASTLPGHVIACRITAENPDEKFQPTSGVIKELNLRSTPNVWGYFSVSANGGVHEFSDSQFGHMFAHGETRELARRNMVLALKELSIRGEIRTTVEYLRTILETEDFRKNHITTSWLEKIMVRPDVATEKPATHLVVLLGAIFKGCNACTSNLKQYTSDLERGQIPRPKANDANVQADISLIYEQTKYEFKVYKSGPESFEVVCGDWNVEARVMHLADDGLLVLLNEKKHVVYGQEFPSGLRLTVDGQTCLFSTEYDPTRLTSNVQGKLVRYLVPSGSHVHKGQPYAEMEVMKMYVTVVAPESGIIRAVKPDNSVVEAGELVATMVLDEPDKVQKAALYDGEFPELLGPHAVGEEASVQLKEAIKKLELILDGYKVGPGQVDRAIKTVMQCLRDPSLPLTQFLESVWSLSGRIPPELWEAFDTITSRYADSITQHKFAWEEQEAFPVLELQHAIDDACHGCVDETEKNTLLQNLDANGVRSLLDRYSAGNSSYAISTISNLIERYLEVETLFNTGEADMEVMKNIRKTKNDIDFIVRVARSHHALRDRNGLISSLLDVIGNQMAPLLGEFMPVIQSLASLGGSEYARIALKTRQLIVRHELPSSQDRRIAIQTILNSCASATSAEGRLDVMRSLLDQSQPLEDIIFNFFESPRVQSAAMELYIRRIYAGYSMGRSVELTVDQQTGGMTGKWNFVDNRHIDLMDMPPTPRSSSRSNQLRQGVMGYYKNYDLLKKGFDSLLGMFDSKTTGQVLNVLYVVVKWSSQIPPSDQMIKYFRSLLANRQDDFAQREIRRITFIVNGTLDSPGYFTFRFPDLEEDPVMRYIEPCYAAHMQLRRLSNFNISIVSNSNHMVHLFEARRPDARSGEPARLFARVLVRKQDHILSSQSKVGVHAHPETEFAFLEALDAVEIAIGGEVNKYHQNHIFINVLVPSDISVDDIQKVFRHLARTHADKVNRLQIAYVEFAIALKDSKDSEKEPKKVRCYYSNPTGHILVAEAYEEVENEETGTTTHKWIPGNYLGGPAPYYDGKDILTPYPISVDLQQQRTVAEKTATLYVYDYLLILEKVLQRQWLKYGKGVQMPNVLMKSTELVLSGDGEDAGLIEVERPHGKNDIGMVAWFVTIYTPFAPQGRDIVIIANDISFQMGTFGPKEDKLFYKASVYARERGLPRLYFSANSGARIGLAEEVRSKFQVAWKDGQPSKGCDYLYLSEEDYKQLTGSVEAEPVEAYINVGPRSGSRETRYKIKHIIGAVDGLGVENLSGSGQIAGETSLAYDEIFTLTYVTGRTVGIGSYLARLGQRCIQKTMAPILLTGYAALNKLLGRSVYSSNLQLGGPDIMYTNGVTHQVVQSDLEGITACVEWLNYVPEKRHAKLPISPAALIDPIDRPIGFTPAAGTPYDPRMLIAGTMDENGEWQSGFFDQGSFMEVLAGWAKTCVCGRARLGGYPMGVVAVEGRTVEQIVPADPANETSKELVLQKAGQVYIFCFVDTYYFGPQKILTGFLTCFFSFQVWYPDSAYKTAQGIRDMIAEDIPLMIFANWRGFSGGQQDMFDEVLKFGSYIVDSLRMYQQPVFVYLPPFSTLRGGAWVVVDSTINEQYMEMYADGDARGGVLEVEGTVEVKFRKHHIIACAHRLDAMLQALDAELKESSKYEKGGANSGSERPPSIRNVSELNEAIKKRELELLPYYHGVTTAFADYHDTPGRMVAKKVIRKQVGWAKARKFFYWRMRRRVWESNVVKVL